MRPRRPGDAAAYRTAFAAFEAMIERGQAPPPSQTVSRTAGGDVANACPLAGAAAGGKAKAKPLRVRVMPRRVRSCRRTRFRVRVTTRGKPVRGAKVRFAGRTKRTGLRGRATLLRRLVRPGLRRVVVRKRGFRTRTVRVRVLTRR